MSLVTHRRFFSKARLQRCRTFDFAPYKDSEITAGKEWRGKGDKEE